MNKQQDQNDSQNIPRIDKTFVEGSGSESPLGELKPGSRIDATSLGTINPYSQTGTNVSQTPSNITSDSLPSGNEPIPLGSGTIVGLLGTGGMAKVYKIWNEKLEVFRAVKILLPTQQSDLKNRFETETKITAKLHHPNIVEIYNVGEWNGLPYLEMEFIDGDSLEAFISNFGKLPDVVCSSIAILIARALSYAHNQEFLIYGKTYHGVIHRDLKPANIMISKTGDVRLMDFGIARPTEASLHTVEGNIVGTMQYLSPEQMDGVDIDCRTDIYSFGAILYEMLTGTKTFPQDTITNLMKKKIMNEYRKFSDFDFQISSAISRLSQKCLQLNKEDRFPNMENLLRELESVHKSICHESPAKILKRYLSDPDSFGKAKNKSALGKFVPKLIIPVCAATIVASLATVFIFTGPKLHTEKKQVSSTLKEKEAIVLKDKQQNLAERQISDQPTSNLKPLSPVDDKPVATKQIVSPPKKPHHLPNR